MKKLLSVLLCVTGSTVFIACQKSHDVSPSPSGELRSEVVSSTATEAGLQSAVSECGQFRTQSQGGWGVNPVGENPGTYLRDNFANAYPTGLTIGCPAGGYTVYYSSASAITEFLPAGGTAMVLTANAINPAAKSIKNVLIGQVTALALNLGFDYNNPNFAPAEENLGNMIIGSGPFAGLSVIQFLGIANDVIGGCNTTYTADAINETASLINGNFIDGTMDGGFLNCPASNPER